MNSVIEVTETEIDGKRVILIQRWAWCCFCGQAETQEKTPGGWKCENCGGLQ